MNVHNPDQYMLELRQILAQGRKRIGFLLGAGTAAGLTQLNSSEPLIPAVASLTRSVIEALHENFGKTLAGLHEELQAPNIEILLSRVRTLATVLGTTVVHELNGDGYRQLGQAICKKIGQAVNQELPPGPSAYTELVSWMAGVNRPHPIEVFTTNYDLLLEQALERAKTPYFDGFTGASEPFFDPSSVASNDLPPRWVRVWKLHGSLGWQANGKGEVIRTGARDATHLVFPEHLKYDQTQKAPYSALFDRLRSFLMTPDTLLITSGFSFADAHVSACIDECLSANPSVSVLAFQFLPIDQQPNASEIALRRSNMSLYAPDQGIINSVIAPWQPGPSPTRDWEAVRDSYWVVETENTGGKFQLGSFNRLARFFASSGSTQYTPAQPDTVGDE